MSRSGRAQPGDEIDLSDVVLTKYKLTKSNEGSFIQSLLCKP